MKLLTRNTDYAIRAVCSMASRQGQVVSVAELVRELKMPRPFLRKILQTMSKAGLVTSTKGIGGGFTLSKDIDKLTLADFVEAFQGPLSINECSFKKKRCPNTGGCPLKKKIDSIGNYVVNELRSITVGSLLKKGS